MVIGVFGLSTSTLTHLLAVWGYPIVMIFVAIESSGIPFPGETMLLVAATYSGMGHLDIQWVIAAAATGAIVGDNVGYAAGRSGGRALLERYGRYIRIRAEHLDRAERFFQRYGDATVFFGRFVAVLRAWAAFLAGTNRMPWPKFLLFNAAGGIVWAIVYGLLGYFLGSNLPLLDRIVKLIGIGGIAVAVVVIIAAFILWRRRKQRTAPPSGSRANRRQP
jgi:membrane protein DedA with SNARE-associated domain